MKEAFIITLTSSIFTWGLTALGSLMVFFVRKQNENIISSLFGFGGGVMVAASFFSLLKPSIDMAIELKQIDWLIVGIGFLVGGLIIFLIDYLFSKLNKKNNGKINKGLLITAITIHNIPEGMAIGVAVGSALFSNIGYEAAIMLAIGIGLQNFPEGLAVSLPLKADGMNSKKAFMYGQLSGIVEPISAILGLLLVYLIKPILPFVLAVAAGTMIYVVIEELIPSCKNNKYCTIGFMVGFVIMMILDVALG